MSAVDDVKDVSETIVEFAEATEKVSGALEKYEALAKAASSLSKMSAGLGALGAGIGLVSALAGAKSDTDRILDAVSALSSQVTSLGEDMLAGFEELKALNKQTASMTALADARARLEVLNGEVMAYRSAVAEDPKNERAALARRHLREWKAKDIRESVLVMYHQLTSDPLSLSTNILASTFATTYGDHRTINRIAGALFATMNMSLVAEVLVATLGPDDDHRPNDGEVGAAREDAVSFYAPLLPVVTEAWQALIVRCRSEMADNVKPKLAELMTSPEFDVHDGGHHVQFVTESLQAQWPWNDWLVIVYSPVDGYEVHGVSGWDYVCIWRTHEVNIIAKWVDSSLPPVGGGRTSTITYEVSRVEGHYAGGASAVDTVTSTVTGPAENAPWRDISTLRTQLNVAYPGIVWHGLHDLVSNVGTTNGDRLLWREGTTSKVAVFL